MIYNNDTQYNIVSTNRMRMFMSHPHEFSNINDPKSVSRKVAIRVIATIGNHWSRITPTLMERRAKNFCEGCKMQNKFKIADLDLYSYSIEQTLTNNYTSK